MNVKLGLALALSPFLLAWCGPLVAARVGQTALMAPRIARSQKMNATLQQMQRIGVAANQYAYDHKGQLPPMQSSQAFARAIAPYAGNRANLLISPATGKRYQLNAKLSGRVLKQIRRENQVVMIYEAQPIPGPNRADEMFRMVGYVDLHFKAEYERNWNRIKKTSGL